MADDRQTALDALEDLLDRERAYVVDGQFDQLSRLAEMKLQLLQQVGALTHEPSIARLKSKAERNAQLLQVAGMGIRSVTQRLSALRDGPEPLTTYSAAGAKTTVGDVKRTVERRA